MVVCKIVSGGELDQNIWTVSACRKCGRLAIARSRWLAWYATWLNL